MTEEEVKEVMRDELSAVFDDIIEKLDGEGGLGWLEDQWFAVLREHLEEG